MFNYISDPTACVARGIENLIIARNNSDNFMVKGAIGLTARAVCLLALPSIMSLELLFKELPKTLAFAALSLVDGKSRDHQVSKFLLGIFFSPLGIRSPDAVSCFFLKSTLRKDVINPYGVERIFGKAKCTIAYPKTINELQQLVKKAKTENKQISVIGAGMSQGTQTIPKDDKNHLVINTKHLNRIFDWGKDNSTVTVDAGITWEELQVEANKRGKSVIVKQASDIFSIGGSIGINCHGWAHEKGALSSTVKSVTYIDADGELVTAKRGSKEFKMMFGTLGYFGIIVQATLELTENEHLVESAVEIDTKDFVAHYNTHIKRKNIPLFGGRLSLDSTGDRIPFEKVCMCTYKKDEDANRAQGTTPLVTKNFSVEKKRGTRIQRISLQLISLISHFSANQLIGKFWNAEKATMMKEKKITRNEALHPPIQALTMLHDSNLHAQWLQEYFVTATELPGFLNYLGTTLKAYNVLTINATIRPTPKDPNSVLPYADKDRFAIVICFEQLKSKPQIESTKKWMNAVNEYLLQHNGGVYQAYMPFATREQFERSYGAKRVAKLRELKKTHDPNHLFGNAHTAKYFDEVPNGQ